MSVTQRPFAVQGTPNAANYIPSVLFVYAVSVLRSVCFVLCAPHTHRKENVPVQFNVIWQDGVAEGWTRTNDLYSFVHHELRTRLGICCISNHLSYLCITTRLSELSTVLFRFATTLPTVWFSYTKCALPFRVSIQAWRRGQELNLH